MPTTRRECPACGGGFLLDAGVARCPHCGRVVSAGIPAGASTLRASDRKGWRFLGQHGGNTASRETPFIVKGQAPDRQAKAVREAMRRTLREKMDYWQAELVDIEAEFGAVAAGKLREFTKEKNR